MKTPLVLVMVALAGSVSAPAADPVPYPDGFPAQPPSDPLVAGPASSADPYFAPPAGGGAGNVPGYPTGDYTSPPPPPQNAGQPPDPGVVRAELVALPGEMSQPAFAPTTLPVPDALSYQYFQQPLQPYGEWVVIAGYGPCWRPRRVHAGWRPYLEGRWVRMNTGWSWASPEPWGWATYHYGRWMLTASFGWVWVPGHEWAPAWVNWRSGEDLVGWEPMPPDVVLDSGFYDDGFGLGIDCWTMVRCGDFLAPNCGSVAFSREACRGWFPKTRAVAGINFARNGVASVGAGHQRIETVTGRGAPTSHLRDAAVPSHRPPVGVEHNSPVVGRPAASLRFPASDASHSDHTSAVPDIRTNTRPPARAPMQSTVSSHETERRPSAVTSRPAMPARSFTPSPSSAPSRSSSWSAPTVSHTSSAAPARSFTPSPSSAPSRSSSWSAPSVSHVPSAPVVHHADPPVHQPSVSSGSHSAPSAPPSHNTGRPSSR